MLSFITVRTRGKVGKKARVLIYVHLIKSAQLENEMMPMELYNGIIK